MTSLAKQAAVPETDTLRGERGHLSHGELEREQLELTHVVAKDTGKCPIGARVSGLAAERSVGRHAAEVGVHGHPPRLHRFLDVGLAHHGVYGVGAMAAFSEHDVEQRLASVAVAGGGD